MNAYLSYKTSPGALAGAFISIIGFLVTMAIRVYDKRNDELYNDLISRGRKIEEELAVDTCMFRGRRNPSSERINHSKPLKLIYGSVMTGWLAIAVWFILNANNVAHQVVDKIK